MEKQVKNRTQAKSQNRSEANNASGGTYETANHPKPNVGLLNIFGIKNKGKSPPGKARSPGG